MTMQANFSDTGIQNEADLFSASLAWKYTYVLVHIFILMTSPLMRFSTRKACYKVLAMVSAEFPPGREWRVEAQNLARYTKIIHYYEIYLDNKAILSYLSPHKYQ